MNIQTLRYYERRRLLARPTRTISGYREYPPATIHLIRFIKRAQDLGFTLNEIKTLVMLREGQGRTRRDVRALAEARMQDVDGKLASLQAMRRALRLLIDSCASREHGPTCPIIEALDDGGDTSEVRCGRATKTSPKKPATEFGK